MNALAPAAVTGTYSDIKLVKTRSVAVIMVEIPIETAGAFVAAFGMPIPGQEVHVAIARLNGAPKAELPPAASVARPARADKRDWSDVPSAEQAGIRCSEMRFWRFLEECRGAAKIASADDCGRELRSILGITSRKEIDSHPAVFRDWEALDAAYRDHCFSEGREVR